MVGIAAKLHYLYPNANPFFDWSVIDDGKTQRIAKWNDAIGPQPSQKDLDAITDQQVEDAIRARFEAKDPDLTVLRKQATQAIADLGGDPDPKVMRDALVLVLKAFTGPTLIQK